MARAGNLPRKSYRSKNIIMNALDSVDVVL